MIEKTVLNCGLIVLSEYVPYFPSFAMSYTFKSGSRAETKESNGIHHLIEHMLFKGSQNYHYKQIAELSDRLGGHLNAFTGKEITQYYIKAIDEKFAHTFQLVSDIVFKSLFPEEEFLKERNVIIQEIKESEDDPDTFVFESFYEKLYPENSLGFPIAGHEQGLALLDRERVFQFYHDDYHPWRMILAVVGKIKHDQVVDMAESFFSEYKPSHPIDFSFPQVQYQALRTNLKNRSLKQLYAIVAFPAISYGHSLRYPFLLMNDILGTGMSSRLVQTIREEKGLAYTINSFCEHFLNSGLLLIYSIIDPEKASEYLNAVQEEIDRIKQKGITDNELEKAKDHIKSSIILGYESNSSKMRYNVIQELYMLQPLDLLEIIDRINQIDKEQIHQLCCEFLNMEQASVFYYGKI